MSFQDFGSWQYCKEVKLTALVIVTDYQMKILVGESAAVTGANVTCEGNIKSNFSDLRFTNYRDDVLNYWIESTSGTTPNQLATVWVKFDRIDTNVTTFKMYYGNASASAVSNADNTLLYFDNQNTDKSSNYSAYSGSWTYDTGNKYIKFIENCGCYINTQQFTDFELFCEMYVTWVNGWFINQKYIQWRTTGNSLSGYSLEWQPLAYTQPQYYRLKSPTTIIDTDATTPPHSTWFTCNVRSAGTSQSAQVGSYHLLTATDATRSSGRIGFSTVTTSANETMYVRNIRIKKSVETEPTWGVWGSQRSPRFLWATFPLYKPGGYV